ncbi:hypothetical protein ACEPPN_019549 [Leptodophora sp. 'Broadleaf-Isolate-01']
MFQAVLLCSAALFAVRVQGQSINCASFWPSLTPGDAFTVDAQCFMYGGFPQPQNVGGPNFRLAVTESLSSNPTYVDTAAGQILEAVSSTVWKYETLQAQLSDIVVILTDFLDPDPAFPKTIAATYRPEYPSGPCQLEIFKPWNDLSEDYRMQALSHELYHCVQQTMLGLPTDASSWWVEGTAAYFMNWVYPTVNQEWERDALFNIDQPIYAETNPYSTEQFFQAMEQSKGAVGIHQWVISQAYSDSLPEERSRLAYASFADDFHLFAKQYSLGKIADSGGGYIPVGAVPTTGAAFNDDTATLTFGTFTMEIFSLDLDPGQTVTIYYTTKLPNVRVSYQQGGMWMKMPNAPVSSAEGTLVVECNDGDSATILVLVTSTDNVDEGTVSLVAAQTSKDEGCQCSNKGPSNKRGVNDCAPSSPISSTSSSESSSATPSVTPTSSLSSSQSTTPTPVPSGSDPCLIGDWNLDIPSMQAYLASHVSTGVEAVTISNLNVGGSSDMHIQTNMSSTMNMNHLTIDYDGDSGGFGFHTSIDIDGSVSGLVTIASDGSSFSWVNGRSSGEVKTLTSVAGLGDPIELDFPVGDQYGSETVVKYTCSGNSLGMAGYLDGKYIWAYTWARA